MASSEGGSIMCGGGEDGRNRSPTCERARKAHALFKGDEQRACVVISSVNEQLKKHSKSLRLTKACLLVPPPWSTRTTAMPAHLSLKSYTSSQNSLDHVPKTAPPFENSTSTFKISITPPRRPSRHIFPPPLPLPNHRLKPPSTPLCKHASEQMLTDRRVILAR